MATTITDRDAGHDRPTSAHESSARAPAKRRSSLLRTVLWTLALCLLSAGAGYLGGRIQASSEVQEANAQRLLASDEHARTLAQLRREQTSEVMRLRSDLGTTQQERVRLERLAALYEGLRRAHEALDELDARNFGDSEERVRAAQRVLAPLAETVPGLSEPFAALAGTQVVVAGNLDGQRRELATIVASLNALVARERGPDTPAAPAVAP